MATANCIMCKIVKGEIPCFKVLETEWTLAFMDINPIASNHILVIPKIHGPLLHTIPDNYLQDLLPLAKKICLALGPPENYNILQNNGRLAHQEVDHVHFHIIPKTEHDGLGIKWPAKKGDMQALGKLTEELRKKLDSQL